MNNSELKMHFSVNGRRASHLIQRWVQDSPSFRTGWSGAQTKFREKRQMEVPPHTWGGGSCALQDKVTGGMARARLSDLGLLGPVPSLTLALLRDSHGLPQSATASI